MQAVIAIPDTHTLNQYGGPAEALMREVCGVPLLVRVIKTAVRAGASEMFCAELLSSSPRHLSLDRTRTGRRSPDWWTTSFSGSRGIG